MTAAEPNHGRLDRILAAQKAAMRARDTRTTTTLGTAVAVPSRTDGGPTLEAARLRAMVVALECENAALTDMATAITHEWATQHPHSACCGAEDLDRVVCGRFAFHPIHRTPAKVRAELEEQR